jgi:hypothetical protein
MSELLNELQSIKWINNCYRPNVSGVNEKNTIKYKRKYGNPCLSYTFGLIRPRFKKDLQLSKVSIQYQYLYKLLQDYIKQIQPGFKYTNITINKNIICQKHVDSKNSSISLAIGLGDYTGGLLFVNDVGYDIKTPLVFDGKNEHYSTEFIGERFSIIYYCHL